MLSSAALAVLRALREQEITLAAATAEAPLFPQCLVNVPIRRGFDWRGNETIRSAERAALTPSDGSGRVLLRPSARSRYFASWRSARSRAADTPPRKSPAAVRKRQHVA